MRTPRSQTVLPTIQTWMMPMHVNNLACGNMGGQEGRAPIPFLMTVAGNEPFGGNLRLVEAWNLCWKWFIQIENSLQNYMNFTLGNRFSWAFKTLKPISFRGLCSLDPRCHDGISDEIVQIDNSVQNYMWILPPILPSKMGFLWALKMLI